MMTPAISVSRGIPVLLPNQPESITNSGAARHFAPATRFDVVTTFFSWAISVALLAFFLIDSRHSDSGGCVHWFVIPTFFCGVLIGLDMVDWFRGRFDIFDPVGLLGIFGFHWFFIAPLLQVDLNFSMIEQRIRPDDIRPWLGWMNVVNFGGLLIYRYLRDPLAGGRRLTSRRVWAMDPARFSIILPIFLIVSVGLQASFYIAQGGIIGYLRWTSSYLHFGEGPSALQTMFAESFPILAMMAYAWFARGRAVLRSWPIVGLALFLFFIAALLFGGLTLSRSNTMFAMFIAVGMVHFFIRPITKKMVILGLVIMFIYAYFYALFYKKGGIQSFEAFTSGAATISDLQENQHAWSGEGLLLAELSRTELQSFILHQITRKDFDYEPSWGRTYYATLCHLVPGFIWPTRPYLLMLESTEMLYGKGSFDPVHNASSYVHGAVGEAMLSFGVLGAFPAFLLWTLIVAKARKWILTWEKNDVRLLLAPWLSCLCISFFMSDSDNMLFFIAKYAGVPMIVLWLSSNHIPFRHYLLNRNRAAVA